MRAVAMLTSFSRSDERLIDDFWGVLFYMIKPCVPFNDYI